MLGAILLVGGKMTAAAAWCAAAVFSLVDPQWATPVNTFLLLVTLIAGAFLSRKVTRVEDKTDRNHETTAHAASASASAAEAAATAARIAKELGGQLRDVRVPATDATGTTEPGGDGA